MIEANKDTFERAQDVTEDALGFARPILATGLHN